MSLNVNRAARAVLLDLEKRNRLDPATVVETAKAPDSPLHRFFEWNTDKAARLYNLEVARSMIRTVRITREITDHGVVRTIRVPPYISDPANRGSYRTVASIVGTRQVRDVFDDVLGEVASAKGHLQRALAIGLTLGFADELRVVIARVVRLKSKIEAGRTTRRKAA
jgi:hypothetical protein